MSNSVSGDEPGCATAEAVVDLTLRAREAASLPRMLRPVERLRTLGVEGLAAVELLGLTLGPARDGEAPEWRARRLLARHGLAGVAELSLAAWQVEGRIGPGTAVRIAAAIEIGRRGAGREPEPKRPRLTRPRDVFDRVRHLVRVKKEHLVGLYLDAQNGLLHEETLSIGSLNTTRTHPREILYPAISHLALGFILAHNHPSGCIEPSREDVEFTDAVKRAGELMGIELYDHLVVGREGYTSLRERGLL